MPRKDRTNRSVSDYDSEYALRKALISMEASDGHEGRTSPNTSKTTSNGTTNSDAVATAASADGAAASASASASVAPQGDDEKKPAAAAAAAGTLANSKADLDWVLPSLDPDSTEVQSMKQELQRLLVLKSYFILDSEREAAFERLTGLASRIFNVPISLVSVVDLGRQWFMSNRGLGDVRETPRRHAFCAHAILSKEGILVVPDATLDFRFKDNPLVTGPPNIRFYAGAPMISPEGYKLGTFCIIDDKTRPGGLTEDEQTSLRDLADMAVKEMVDRQSKTNKNQQSPAQLIAYTAHDLMTPLSGVQLSLSLLKEDEEVKSRLGYHQLELLSTAANCSDLMIRICQTAIDTLRQESSTARKLATTSAAAGSAAANAAQNQQSANNDINAAPMTEMSELINSLAMVMEPIPKLAPLIITLEESVPPVILCDDLKLFRSALNLISNALPRTELGAVHLRIYPETVPAARKGDGDSSRRPGKLMFECTDTGPDIEVEHYQHLFQPSRVEADGGLCLGLSSVATLINSLGGEYGFRPLGEESATAATDGSGGSGSGVAATAGAAAVVEPVPPPAQKRRTNTGSLFWFSVPLAVPDHVISKEEAAGLIPASLLHKKGDSLKSLTGAGSGSSLIERSLSSSRIAGSNGGSNTSVSSTGKRRIPVIVGSVFDSGALQNSCFLPGGTDVGRSGMSLSDIAKAREGLGLGGGADGDDRKMPALPTTTIHNEATASNTTTVAGATATVAPSVSTAATAAAPSAPTATRKKRGLVIEDSLVVRKSLSRALAKMGFDVTQAVNGLEGLNRLKETCFDLVLCDFLMPVMDGMDCVKQYRDWEKEHRIGFHQYIVGISAHATSNDGDQGIKAGMDSFKQKPISVRLLMEFQEMDGFRKCSTMIDEMEPPTPGAQTIAAIPVPIVVNQGEPSDAHTRKAAASNVKDDAASAARPVKRQRHDDESVQMQKPATPVCLMATDKPTKQSNEVLTKLEKSGWKTVISNDGHDALRLLQMRNWDAILIDDDIPLLAGTPCMEKFRSWEAENRVNRQRRAYLCVSNAEIPSPFDKASIVLPPHGFDGVLSKPVQWSDLSRMLLQTRERSFDIVVRK